MLRVASGSRDPPPRSHFHASSGAPPGAWVTASKIDLLRDRGGRRRPDGSDFEAEFYLTSSPASAFSRFACHDSEVNQDVPLRYRGLIIYGGIAPPGIPESTDYP